MHAYAYSPEKVIPVKPPGAVDREFVYIVFSSPPTTQSTIKQPTILLLLLLPLLSLRAPSLLLRNDLTLIRAPSLSLTNDLTLKKVTLRAPSLSLTNDIRLIRGNGVRAWPSEPDFSRRGARMTVVANAQTPSNYNAIIL